jgi:hypothetical protein
MQESLTEDQVSKAQNLVANLLRKILARGFFGEVAVSMSVQDGMIQEFKSTVQERMRP